MQVKMGETKKTNYAEALFTHNFLLYVQVESLNVSKLLD